MDVPVTVSIQMINPAGSQLTTTTPSISGSTYTSTAMVSSFGRYQSGVYTCIATVSSTSSFLSNYSQSGTARITTGKTADRTCHKIFTIQPCKTLQVFTFLTMELLLSLTAASSSLTLGLHIFSSWSVHLTGCHVARLNLGMGSGIFLMEVKSSTTVREQYHFEETEMIMEISAYIV